MVSAAGAAHDGVGAAGHPPLGAGGHLDHNVAHEVGAHDVGGQLALEGVRDADAQTVLQAVVREGLVHLGALHHKGELLFTGAVHQLPDLGHRHVLELLMEGVLPAGGIFLFKEHFVVGAGIDNVGVGIADGADADAPGGDNLGVGVELLLLLGDGDAHLLLLHQAGGLLADDAVDLLQQLQSLLRVAQAGPQGGGVLQAHPVKAGDAHRHAVFVDAGVDLDLDGHHLSADGVVGVGGAQSHTHRLGASQGGDYLLPQQGEHFFFGQLHGHSPSCYRIFPGADGFVSPPVFLQPACQSGTDAKKSLYRGAEAEKPSFSS